MRGLAAALLFCLVAGDVRSAEVGADQPALTQFLVSPAASPLLTALGLENLNAAESAAVAQALSLAQVDASQLAALPATVQQVALIQARARSYAASGHAQAQDLSAAILSALVPVRLEATSALVSQRIEQARQAWSARAADAPAALGSEGAAAANRLLPSSARQAVAPHEPPAPQAPRPGALPFAPTRAISLSHAAAVMQQRVASGATLGEADYRRLDPQQLFPGAETTRMDTLISRQAADPAQAMLEVITNGQDASVPQRRKVGRFGVGGLQILGELKKPEDRVVLQTSKGDGVEAQFVFWKNDGEIFFDYRLAPSARKGSRFQALTALGDDGVKRREEFLERKLRANDRGPVEWTSGKRLNRPERFLEYGAAAPSAADAPPVTVRVDARGYEISDSGVGMGLKEVFERYLKPYGTDKPVAPTQDPARLLHRAADASRPRISLGVATVEIEEVALDEGGRRLNLAGDVFIDLPHDTDLTEDRGVISLVPADQSINGAIRGLRLLIDRLTDPAIVDPARFALINSLAAVIRQKQPANEKGVTRERPETATDLLWYLRHRLAASGLLEQAHKDGFAFLPNSPKWAPLVGVSDKIVFLDEALFTATMRDYGNAGFEPLPFVLAQQPGLRALKENSRAEYYTRALRRGGPLAVVDGGVVVIDKALAESTRDGEVLAARIARELAGSAAPAPAARDRNSRNWRSAVKTAAYSLVLAAALTTAAAFHPHFSLSHPAPAPAAASRPAAAPQPAAAAQPAAVVMYHPSRSRFNGHPAMPGRSEAAATDEKPQQAFGRYSSPSLVDSFFVSSIKTHILTNGNWAVEEARWAPRVDPPEVVNAIDVSYRLDASAGEAQRLFNQTNGRIRMIDARDLAGNLLISRFDSDADALTIDGYSGPAVVHYEIEVGRSVNGIDAESQPPLPDNELADMPTQWRDALDQVKDAPGQEKLDVINGLMARDFAYDESLPFHYDGRSWGHTAQGYLDRGVRLPVICNESSLYYYLMARYVGLPAAYVEYQNTEDGVFYADLAGHARAAVKTDGEWKFVETTSLMPFKAKASRVITPKPDPVQDLPSKPSSGKTALDIVLRALVGAILLALGGLLISAARHLFKIRRRLAPLRQAQALLESSWRPRFGTWLRWLPLGKDGSTAYWSTPAGTVYRKDTPYWRPWPFKQQKWGRQRVFVSTEGGGLRPVNATNLQVAGRHLVWRTATGRVQVYDGKRIRTIFREWPFTSKIELLRGDGRRVYALRGARLLRVDPEAGRLRNLIGLPAESPELIALDSVGGIKRIAVVLPGGSGRMSVRTLAVSGDVARWEGPEEQVSYAGKTNPENWKVWPAGERTVYSFHTFDKKGGFKRNLFVSGEKSAMIVPGDVSAVVAGKVFVSSGEGHKVYDLAARRWVPARLGSVDVKRVASVGEDLFTVEGMQGDRPRAYFCDADGQEIADHGGWAMKAIRRGDTVYYSRYSDGRLYAASGDGPVRRFELPSLDQRLYSDLCARATGLDPEAFKSLDDGWRGQDRELFAAKDPKIFSEAVRADRAFIDRLEPALREAAPYRAAMMSEWSLARLFLSPEQSTFPLALETRVRLDRLVRDNIARPAWLREAFELVDAVCNLRVPGPDAAIGHYLDLIEAAPEFLFDLREALLTPALLADGTRVDPLKVLNQGKKSRLEELPAVTQLYLQMLRHGAESLLRREPEGAPGGPVVAAVEGGDASLSRLIAAASAVPESELDYGGLEALARAAEESPPEARADLSSIRGVVMSQGLSAPVWIRELVQNARDAVRESRRLGHGVSPRVDLRSYLSEDGSRWIVSVRDGVGMKLGRLLKYMLVPDATTKTLADEVRGFLALGGASEDKVQRLLAEFFDDAARADAGVVDFLRKALALPEEQAAKRVAEGLAERMKKGGAGFFGIGFFTVFAGADEVVVRTGSGGRLYEAALVPVRDENGRLIDIRRRWLREYADPTATHQGTEVLRIKSVTPQNIGRVLIENAYVHIMARKFLGGVSDVELALNGKSIQDALETVAVRNGVRSRIGAAAQPRWSVDELFVQDAPSEALRLIPAQARAGLQAAGWNLDFPAATAVVRTRASVQEPGRYAATAAALAVFAAQRLYRDGRLQPPGMPTYRAYRKISPWDAPAPTEELRRDADAVAAGADTPALWGRYISEPRRWAELMLAVCDDKEKALRKILGPQLCAALDALRARGEPLRAGSLPSEEAPDYERQVRKIHAEALARADQGGAGGPAAAGLSRALARLASFMESPPPFVAVDAEVLEATRRCLDEGLAVPLMESFLAACGRTSDAAAVTLFESWLKGRGAKKELEALLLGGLSRAALEPSLQALSRAAARGQSLSISVMRENTQKRA